MYIKKEKHTSKISAPSCMVKMNSYMYVVMPHGWPGFLIVILCLLSGPPYENFPMGWWVRKTMGAHYTGAMFSLIL